MNLNLKSSFSIAITHEPALPSGKILNVIEDIERGSSEYHFKAWINTVQYGLHGEAASPVVLLTFEFLVLETDDPPVFFERIEAEFYCTESDLQSRLPRFRYLTDAEDNELASKVIHNVPWIPRSICDGNRTLCWRGEDLRNYDASEGISSKFLAYALVESGGDLLIRVTFKSYITIADDTGPDGVSPNHYSALGLSISAPTPMVFQPGQSLGRQYRDLSFISVDGSKISSGGAENSPPLPMSRKPKSDSGTKSSSNWESGKTKTIRVTRIPLEFNRTDVRQILCPAAPTSIGIVSLAIDPDDPRQFQVATFSSDGLKIPKLDFLSLDSPQHWPYQDVQGLSGKVVLDCSFLGMTVLASPKVSETSMDLIAVSGLNGHAFGSWKARGVDHMWLRDGLPQVLLKTRIMIYGFDSRLGGSSSYATISNYGKSFLHEMARVRSKDNSTRRPLVLIGHSLGGLLIKEAIVYASRAESSETEILNSLQGLVFMGVPHRGLKVEHLLAMVEGQPNQKFVAALEPESYYLNALHESFVHAIKDAQPKIFSWYETSESKTIVKVGDDWKAEGPPARLVSQSSSTNATSYEKPSDQYPIDRSHSEMVKFGVSDVYYKQLCGQLRELEADAGLWLAASTSPKSLKHHRSRLKSQTNENGLYFPRNLPIRPTGPRPPKQVLALPKPPSSEDDDETF